MGQNVFIAFGITFVLGPLICAILLRVLPARPLSIAALAVPIAAAILLANRGLSGGIQSGDMHPGGGAMILALGFLWLAWVLGVTMLALALKRHIGAPRLHRWITLGAVLATTLPWFGLATAQMMG